MSEGVTVRVRYFAGARAASGVEEEPLLVPAGATVADVVRVAAERHGERLATVLAASSFLVDGVAARRRDTPVGEGVQVDVLPPFAGG